MGQKLPSKDMELYRRTDEVLHYLWDPIGVAECPEARDEYYGYLPNVFALLRDGADEGEIADYLVRVEVERMGGRSFPDRAREVARVLLRYRELTREGAS